MKEHATGSMPDITFIHTIETPEQRAQCAEILYAAFHQKIGMLKLFTRSQEQTLRLIEHSLQPEMGIYALQHGRLVGVAGLQSHKQTFMVISMRDLFAEFGTLGGLLRLFWLWLMSWGETPRREHLRIEMLAVDASTRGGGVGTCLLQAVIDKARREGYRAVVLEVMDTNPDARRLYERIGFRQVHHMQTAVITARAGFGGFIRMQLDL